LRWEGRPRAESSPSRSCSYFSANYEGSCIWRRYENVKGEALGFPPELLFDGFAMNQFTLIAICLGLASSALGTCTSSIPSR
jgi:hypothetical protein